MGTVRLHVTVIEGAGVQASWLRIDNQSVDINDGSGVVDVDGDELQQSYAYWFLGDSGAQFSFEIKQSNRSLKTVKDSIAVGYNRGVGSGHFKLTSPAGLW